MIAEKLATGRRRRRSDHPSAAAPAPLKVAEPDAPTYAELMVEVAVARVGRYREIVRQAAGGWSLSSRDSDEVFRLLLQLELPTWCFPRDVAAARSFWAAETDHRKRELAWLYPHLFADPVRWAELRRDERGNRRRVLAELRQAIADGK